MHDASRTGTLPLADLRVIDVSTLFAGPTVTTVLADFGADVVKVEHPTGDGQRRMGWQADGESLLWTVTNRNKRAITLDLHKPQAQEIFRRLADTADVVVENFRPGTLDRWNLSYERLAERNPGLVLVRVTAFGQTGPWATRPGFGTIAEAMSGFTHVNGHPDGPPTLPPFALGDTIAGVLGAAATLVALHARDRNGGVGQEIDLSIYEPLFWILGPQLSVYDVLGQAQERTGNRAPFTAPRNMYRCADGRWVAVSASTQSVAERLMAMVGRPEFAAEPWFTDHVGRLEHQDQLDGVIAAWIQARDYPAVIAAAEKYQVALGPSLSVADIAEHEQYLARESFVALPHRVSGRPVRLQNVTPRLSRTPGAHRWLAPELAEHNGEILIDELGYSAQDLARWKAEGVV